jgi:hypothetical protein
MQTQSCRMASARDALLQALDRADAPVNFFVRDDDAGWADDRLFALLRVMDEAEVPIDLAAIPTAVTPELGCELKARIRAGQRLGIHQHGFAHLNHETQGRKCEFGAGRELVRREADLRRGRDILRAAFEESLDPIFTPPWNRVSPDTPFMLAALGFKALSRDMTAPEQHALPEVVVHCDWSRQWRLAEQVRHDAARRIADDLARHVAPGASVGLMLHHAVMGPAELDSLAELLAAWASHPNARWLPMMALLEQSHAALSLG